MRLMIALAVLTALGPAREALSQESPETPRCIGDIVGNWKHLASGNFVKFTSDCVFQGTECEYVGRILNPPKSDEGTMLVRLESSKGGEGCLRPGTEPCKYRVYKNKTPLEAVVACGKEPPRTIVRE